MGNFSQQRNGGPDGPDHGAARHHPQRRCHAEAALWYAVGTGIASGHADGLIHQLLLADPRPVAAENKNRLFKNLRVGAVHHNDPAGNTFYQNHALLVD